MEFKIKTIPKKRYNGDNFTLKIMNIRTIFSLLSNYIKRSKELVMNDYIQTMRRMVGHETLLTVGCGAIIEDEYGRILLQHRTDADVWGIPGGVMEIGETFLETLEREVYEETNLKIYHPQLFGLYSGKKGLTQYANGDKVYSIQIIFHVREFEGELKRNNESRELRFLHNNELPPNINPHQAPFIYDWVEGVSTPIIK
jgi:ADP-ribose pyrophosphatase YjhB (NUDIX family)